MVYQFVAPSRPTDGDRSCVVKRAGDGGFIALNQGNSDCAIFLAAWKSGEAAVLNADGSPAPYSDKAVTDLGLSPPK